MRTPSRPSPAAALVAPPLPDPAPAAGTPTLSPTLSKDSEIAAAVKALTSILEPVMIVIVGGLVGFIVISMFLPLVDVISQLSSGGGDDEGGGE